MAQAMGGAAAGQRSRMRKRRSQEEDEVDIFTWQEELCQRVEVRFINNFVVIRAYILRGLRGLSYLGLLWSTVVLLGGFITTLQKIDFWYLTLLTFVQATGMFTALGNVKFLTYLEWVMSPMGMLFDLVELQGPTVSEEVYISWRAWLLFWLKKGFYITGCAIRYIALAVVMNIYVPVSIACYVLPVSLVTYVPIACYVLPVSRLLRQDYGFEDGDASKANLKPALNMFYSLYLVQVAMYYIWLGFEFSIGTRLLQFVSLEYGLNSSLVEEYLSETKRRYENDPASLRSWNLLTYGASLLDSTLPDEYQRGVSVLNHLIGEGMPTRRLLILLPRSQIQKLIGTLCLIGPSDWHTRGATAAIVAHLSGDLNLSQFPGALECISTLLDLDIPSHQTGPHFVTGCSLVASRRTTTAERVAHMIRWIRRYRAQKEGRAQYSKRHVDSSNAWRGTCEDLILQGLRILENLADDEHSCTTIYNTKSLLSKIVAPVSSNNLIHDTEMNEAWAEVVDGSLKVVSRLMGAAGDTGKEMRRQIADNKRAVENLEAVLSLEIKSNMLELQTRAIDVLAQVFSDDQSRGWDRNGRENLIKRALHIFLTDRWMEDGLAEQRAEIDKDTERLLKEDTNKELEKSNKAREKVVEKKMKQAELTASLLKEKAGEALAMLTVGSQCNSEVVAGNGDTIRGLTEMLDSKTKTTINCRTAAAEILKNLSTYCTSEHGYVWKTTLKKVLEELLHINMESQELAYSTSTRNDIENPPPATLVGVQHQPPSPQSHKQQSKKRRLKAELLSLCTRLIKAGNLGSVVFGKENFVEKLQQLVLENNHATPECLAILKLACEMVIAMIPHDQTVQEIEKKNEIIETLARVSQTMAGLESCMLFAGADPDCHGVPLKPLSSLLVNQARQLLSRKERDLGIYLPAGA